MKNMLAPGISIDMARRMADKCPTSIVVVAARKPEITYPGAKEVL